MNLRKSKWGWEELEKGKEREGMNSDFKKLFFKKKVERKKRG